MGNINDVITNANSALIDTHANVQPNVDNTNAKYIGKNKKGYPLFMQDGRRVIRLGFYVSEQKFEEYYQVAKQVHETGMKAPTGNGQKLLPSEPNVNSLLHYSLDFFCNNFRISQNLKPKDIYDLSKMLMKQMPSFMKR